MSQSKEAETKIIEMRRLIGKVAERHDIRIDLDDPAFYVLSLTEFALEEATKGIVEGIRNAVQEFEQASDKVQHQAGAILAEHTKEGISEAKQELNNHVVAITAAATEKLDKLYRIHTRFVRHWAAVAGGSLLIFLIGMLVGRFWH